MPHHGESGVGGYAHHFRYLWYEFAKTSINLKAFMPGPPCRVFLVPINIPVSFTVDRLLYLVNVQAGNVRLGLYADNGDAPDGGALIVETASLAMGVGGNKDEKVVAATMCAAGEYWLAIQGDNAGGSMWQGRITISCGGTLFTRQYDLAGGYGAFTNPCPVTAAYPSESPIMGVRGAVS